MPYFSPYSYGSRVWDDLYDRSEYYYDPLTGLYVRHAVRSPILSPVLRPAVVHASPSFGSSSSAYMQPAPASGSSGYTQPIHSAAPPAEINISIPSGHPFMDSRVMNAYHNASRKGRGLPEGIGKGVPIEEDARQIVEMMKAAQDPQVQLDIEEIHGEEAQIEYVKKKLRDLGYNF
jgi:hypothetical protein